MKKITRLTETDLTKLIKKVLNENMDMKYTQNQVKDSIMFFAEQFGLSKSYKALIDSGLGLPELVKMMVYEMFLQKFSSYGSDDISYENYKIIHRYASELKQNGFVNFED